MLVQLILIAVTFLFYLAWKRHNYMRKWDHFPGPKGYQALPFLGHAYLLGDDPIKSLLEMQRKYGNVFRLDLGPSPTVIIADYEEASEAYKLQSFSDRPFQPGVAATREIDPDGEPCGVAFSNGSPWQENRKMMTNTLTKMGMGNANVMETVMGQEAENFCEILREMTKLEKTIKVNNLFVKLVNTSVWRLCNGKDIKQTSTETDESIKAVLKFEKSLDPGSVYNVIQINNGTILKILRTLGLENIGDSCLPMKSWLRKEIAHSSPNMEGFYIDRVLAEIKKNEEQGNTGATFYGEKGRAHLLGSLVDLFIAGTDTVSCFLEWSVYYLISHPDIQTKVHQEIDEAIGLDRPVLLEDKKITPYCEAVIEEIMRFSPETFLTLPHVTSEDSVLGGYKIPKGTSTLIFNGGFHLSKKHFEDPMTFKPERFITESGHFKSNSKICFFGTGKRRCPGEILARAMVYIFFVTLFQQFKIAAPPGFKATDKAQPGIVYYPPVFEARFQPKK